MTNYPNYIGVQIAAFLPAFARQQRGSISISESIPVWWKVVNSMECTSFEIFSSDSRWWTLFMKMMPPTNVSHHRFLVGKFLDVSVVLVSSTRAMRYNSITTTNSWPRTSKSAERLGSAKLTGETREKQQPTLGISDCDQTNNFVVVVFLWQVSPIHWEITETFHHLLRKKKLFTGKFIWKFAAFSHFCRLFVSPLSERDFCQHKKILRTQRRRSSTLWENINCDLNCWESMTNRIKVKLMEFNQWNKLIW